MCKAFSGLITKSGKTYWKMGVDSHDQQQAMFVKKDSELKDDKLPPDNTFARFEIVPKNNDYFSPDKWVFELDEEVKPSWWTKSLEKPCFAAHKQWLKELYPLVKLDEVRNLINPLADIPERKRVTEKDLAMLKEWDSVRGLVWDSVWDSVRASVEDSVRASMEDSVGDSVEDSVRASVRASMGASVGDSVEDLVWDSVWASVRAYIGSLFVIKDWKYINWRKNPFNRIGKGNYLFRSGDYLWRHGLVPSYDGEVWRLHTGPEAKVIWEGAV